MIKGSPGQRFVVALLGAMVGSVLGIGIALSLATATDASIGQRLGAAVACTAGLAAGQVLPRRNIPVVVLDGMLIGADIVLAIGGATGGPLYPLLPAIVVSLGVPMFVIRALGSSLRHVAVLGACYGYVLAAGPDVDHPVTRWVAVMAAVLISGLFARHLVGRVTRLAAAELEARLDVERATVELEGESDVKTAFLARMSHELRTPLNVVVGFADVLRDGLAGSLSDRQQGYVEDIAGSGRDLLRLVDELLDVTKVESGALELDLARMDVASAVAEAMLLVEGTARDRGVTIQSTRPARPVLVHADALRIRQVAWNLIGNAVKFSPRGSVVRVSVSADDERVQVAVRDVGPGIETSDRERIFERYAQGRHQAGGSGIGLALSRHLIEAHGGRLHLESRPGSGSTFTFELPRRRPEPEDLPDRARTTEEPDSTAWTELEQAVLVPGSRAALIATAQVGQWFSASAAILLPVLALITPGPVGLRIAVGAVAVASLLVERLMSNRAEGLPLRTIDFIGTFGTVAVSIGVLVAGPFSDVVALAFGWNVMAASALLSQRRALVQIAFTATAYAVVLVIDQPAEALHRWIAVVMMVCANTVVIGWVAGRLREAMSEALSSRLAAEATRSQVEAVSAHKSDFLANTSHELCTPLNAIIGFAQVLRDELAGPLEPKQASYLEDILESGQHLLALITDLLDLAKLEAGRLARSPQHASLGALVTTAITEVTPAAERRGIQLLVDVPPDLPDLIADPGHLYHALSNLLANAVKFTSDGGRVEVLTRTTAGRILVSVRDTGIGILPEQRAHLFEAFHQGSRPLPPHARGGTGLGLTLAKGLVELEGGEITVESTPNVGSTFTIVLASQQSAEPAAAEAMT